MAETYEVLETGPLITVAVQRDPRTIDGAPRFGGRPAVEVTVPGAGFRPLTICRPYADADDALAVAKVLARGALPKKPALTKYKKS